VSRQPDALAHALTGMVNANNTVFNVLLRTLHEHRLLDKDKFRTNLLELAEQLTTPAGGPRYDTIQFRNLAALLADPDLPQGWRPAVIQGEKTDPKDR
jgi:hypothetical protein